MKSTRTNDYVKNTDLNALSRLESYKARPVKRLQSEDECRL